MVTPNTPAYLKTWADEIASRANRVRQLIGAAHWLSDGMYKEFVFRSVLTRHLPSFICSCSGFIRDISQADACSPQIDVLVTDPTRHIPLLNEGDLQIVVPSSVLAVVEVKSTYSAETLKQAVRNVSTSLQIAGQREANSRIWSAAVFGSPGTAFSLRKLVAGIETAIQAESSSEDRRTSGDDAPLPSCIAIHEGGLAMVDRQETGETLIRAFGCPEISVSLAIAQLLAHVQSNCRRDGQPGELDDLLRSFIPDVELIEQRVGNQGNVNG